MAINKLPARYVSFVLPLIISIFMSCIVSGIATLRTITPGHDFFPTWMSNWGFSWIVAFPVLFLVMPVARKLAYLFVKQPGEL